MLCTYPPLHQLHVGFSQLCWHNFGIIGTILSSISIEHYSRIIGEQNKFGGVVLLKEAWFNIKGGGKCKDHMATGLCATRPFSSRLYMPVMLQYNNRK